MTLPEPSAEERQVLRTIWDMASATSCWPMYLEVARRLSHQGTLDLPNVLQRLDGRRLVGFNEPLRDGSIICLSVAGAAECHVSAEVLSAFLAIAKAAGEAFTGIERGVTYDP